MLGLSARKLYQPRLETLEDRRVPATGLPSFVGFLAPHPVIAHTSSISGTVFQDLNHNGVQNTGEAGIAGVTVYLVGTSKAHDFVFTSASTDASGAYHFDNLAAGHYSLFEIEPAGFKNGKGIVGSAGGHAAGELIFDLHLHPNENGTGYNFAETPKQTQPAPASLSGYVFVDSDGSGTRESGEPGLAGITVTLLDSSNKVVATTQTDSTGFYTFGNLAAGTYTVSEGALPTGYINGRAVTGTVNDTAVGNNTVNGQISGIVLTAGSQGTNYDLTALVQQVHIIG